MIPVQVASRLYYPIKKLDLFQVVRQLSIRFHQVSSHYSTKIKYPNEGLQCARSYCFPECFNHACETKILNIEFYTVDFGQ